MMSIERSGPTRVLVIDGHRCSLWALEKLIEDAKPDMEVVGSTTDCVEALVLLDRTAPDVVLLGVDLAAPSGFETISRLRARSPAKLLVLTAVADRTAHGQAVLAGASGVIETATPVEMIVTAISKIQQGQLWLDRTTTGRILADLLVRSSLHLATPERHRIASLTQREREIITCLSRYTSLPAGQVAQRLHISEHTLRNHLTAIYGKLGVTSRLGLFAFAQRHGLDGPVRSSTSP